MATDDGTIAEAAVSPAELSTGIVAILDRLGTKGIWTRSDPARVIASWECVLGNFKEAVAQHEANEGSWGPLGRPRSNIAAFSDTIILTIEGADPARFLPLLITLIGGPFVRAMIAEVYLRGVFSIGSFYRTDTLILGPAVDEAAEWYELPDWMGVSAAPSAAFGIERLVEQGAPVQDWFTRYDVPLRSGVYKNGWAISWPTYLADNPLPGRVISDRGLLLEMFSRNPVGVAALPKYQNTLAFIEHVRELKRQG